jgi:2-dehydropantoate 2-reductase
VRLAILGPGGVGGLLAAALQRAGMPVVLIAREGTAEVLRRDGLRVRSVALDDEWVARPQVVTRLEEPADVLVVATKAVGRDAALDRVAAAPGAVLPLLNGLDHVALLRARYGDARVAASVIRVQSDRPAPGVIEQTSPALRIDVAAGGPDVAGALDALRRAGVDVRVGGSEADVMWGKLVRLNALAASTTAFDRTLGEIRAEPALLEQLMEVVGEGAQVARADGAAIDPEVARAEVSELHDGQGSSMWRDVAAGREPELDAICGAVLRAGARHGVPCPVLASLTAQIAARAGVPDPAAALR